MKPLGRQLEDLTLAEKKALAHQIRDKKNGILDKDWAELCDEYALDISPDTLRKAAVGVKLLDDACMFQDYDIDTVETLSGGYVERQKLRDLTARANDVFRAESRSQLLRENIYEAIRTLPKLEPCNTSDIIERPESEKELVLCLGDFHFGAEISVEGLEGEIINEYNEEVFKRRMSDVYRETISILRKEKIGRVHVFLVGDLIDGMLRQSQLMRLQYGIVESTIRFSELMANWIASLGAVTNVDVYACTGNHSEVRPLKAKAREYEDENMEKVIMWYLEERCNRYKNIRAHADCKRYVKADVCGYSFLLLHGDGGAHITQLARDAVNLYSKPIDFFICGHKHSEAEFPSGVTKDGHSVVIRVPSLCGIDHFAQSLGCGGSAGATAIVMEPGYGRRCVYPIVVK